MSNFAAGNFVFPGGKIDSVDFEFANKLSPVDNWLDAGRLSPEQQGAVLLGAIRETYEETGLLGRDAPTSPFPDQNAPSPDFFQAMEDNGNPLPDLRYWCNWLTPDPLPVRFDTYFFVLEVHPGASIRPHETEIEEIRWLEPSRALELHNAGQIEMMFPTVASLEFIARFESTTDFLDAAERFPSRTIQPTVSVSTGGDVSVKMPDWWAKE